MDFSFSDEQEAIREVAARILGDLSTPQRLKALEAADEPVDAAVWRALAEANLLGVVVPEEIGGLGLGLVEAAVLLEEVGRRAAIVPVWETLVLGALPIVELGTPDQWKRWLPQVVRGDSVLTAALVEPGGDPLRPLTTTAVPDGDGWRLDGVKLCVPAGLVAERIIVPAATGDDSAGDDTVGLFVVDARSPGVTLDRQDTTSGVPEAQLVLDGVRVPPGDVLGDARNGAAGLEWLVERATATLCALALGVCEEALRLTAEYVKTRKQFDRVIATFQAVGQRAADAYIETEAIRLTTWQAVWRLASGLPAASEVAVAKFWAADGGQRVVHGAQHLHGGIGVDRDYPLHRYFLRAKQLELTLGGATAQLVRLGGLLAAEPT